MINTEFKITKYVGETPIYQTPPLEMRLLKFRRTKQPAILCLLSNVGSRHQKTIMYTNLHPQHTAPAARACCGSFGGIFERGRGFFSLGKARRIISHADGGTLIGPRGLKRVNKLQLDEWDLPDVQNLSCLLYIIVSVCECV